MQLTYSYTHNIHACGPKTFQEDLTPETTIKILDDLKASKNPKPGPQSGRHTCEPANGYTTLLGEPYGPDFKIRKDLMDTPASEGSTTA